MAKIDLSKYIDNSLRAEFEAKPYDAEKARKPVVDGIARTLEQFNSKTPSKAPNKWFKATDKIVRFKAKIGGRVLPINGEEENHIPRSQFAGFLADFKKSVEAGDFDAEIKAAQAGSAKGGPAGTTSGTRTYSEASKLNIRVGGFRRGGMADDEIRAKLKAEGISKEAIDAAIARKPAPKK